MTSNAESENALVVPMTEEERVEAAIASWPSVESITLTMIQLLDSAEPEGTDVTLIGGTASTKIVRAAKEFSWREELGEL
jgi:hypothetical protein